MYPHIIKNDTIYHVSQDHTQKYWLGAKGKIISIDKEGESQIISKGLYNLTTQQLVNLTNKLKLKAFPAYFTIDSEDNVWLSINGDGIYCIYPSPFQNFNSNDGLSTNFIMALQEDAQGNIYAGSINGLFKYRNQHFERKPLLANNTSYHIHELTSNYQKNILINTTVESQLSQGHYLMILDKGNVRKIMKDSIAINQYLHREITPVKLH